MNLTKIISIHIDLDGRENYYGAVCNRGGCSQVDSRNPATLREDR